MAFSFQPRARSTRSPEPVFSASSTVTKTVTAHSEKLLGDIASLFNDARYSDATVRIRDVTLPVHKIIICLQTEYFEKAFRKEFVEGSSGTITFNEGSGAAYWRVFEYLYTGDYLGELSTDKFKDKLVTDILVITKQQLDDPELLQDPRVYALADMLLLEDLKALCVGKLKSKVKTLWDSDSFPDCIREVYASTTDSNSGMRLAVLEVATAHARELRNKETFTDLLREGGDFSVEYVDALTNRVMR